MLTCISNKPSRNILVDCLKGMGIILMVSAHGGLGYKNFIYLFHMPLFFIVSGMCYVYGKDTFDTFVIKKIRNLYLPYLFINVFWYLYEDIGYTIENGVNAVNWLVVFEQIRNVLIFSGDVTLLTIPTWFFKTLFWAIIFYDLINRFLHAQIKEDIKIAKIRLVILVALLIFGWLEKICLDDYWGNIFCSMILFEVGLYINKILKILKKFTQKNTLLWLLVFILSFFILLKMSNHEIELSQNQIVNPVFFVCGSSVGFAFLYAIYRLIVMQSKQIQTILSYIGRNSIWIVTLHLFAFRIVALIQIKFYGLPMTEINQLFRPITEPHWWIVYSVVGIAVPLLGKECFDLVKSKLKDNQ